MTSKRVMTGAMSVSYLSLFYWPVLVLHIAVAVLHEDAVYHTFDGNICEGPCQNISTWCNTVDHSWDYCSNYEAKELEVGHVSKYQYSPCLSECDPTTLKCTNLYGSAVRCYPEDVIYFTKDYTWKGTYCATPCLKYQNSKYKCYDSTKIWQSCIPFPNKQKKIIEIFRGINVYGAYTEQGYRQCGQCECSPGVHIKNSNQGNFATTSTNRTKRDYSDMTNEVNMNSIIAYYEDQFPVAVVRQLSFDHVMSRNETNPILSYHMMPMVGEWTDKGHEQVFLPLMVSSLITNYTRPSQLRARSSLPTRVEANYRKMDPAPGDERSHIVAHRFNGPSEVFNIFPGTRFLNRGQGSPWTYLENAIANFVNVNEGGYVLHTAVLSYDFEEFIQCTYLKDVVPRLNLRPNAIGLSVKYYNQQHVLTDEHGQPLGDIPNPYENMFFSNNADFCCALDYLEDGII